MIKLQIDNHQVKPGGVESLELNEIKCSNEEMLGDTIQELLDLLKGRVELPDFNPDPQEKILNCLSLLESLLEDLVPPSDGQVLMENPHFGPVVRVVFPIEPYDGKMTDKFSHAVMMGAHDSKIEGYMGSPGTIRDAWASYLWHTETKQWILGEN